MATEKNKKGKSFLVYVVYAFIASIILAMPVGFVMYAVGFMLSGGPGGQASDFSKFIADVICFPVIILFPVLNPIVGDLLAVTLCLGFFYSFLFLFALAVIRWWQQNRFR
ncbi:MAG: hypothetical protein FWC50_15380 [Planctomycetaceae bacterium]|nr:hypothetical protein [Planctomycetaceae bacterium]